ncbi:MAG: hypothetical protein V1722_03285 [Candidatus Micrarchaeota archaeon]
MSKLFVFIALLSLSIFVVAESAYSSEAETSAVGQALALKCIESYGNCNCGELRGASAVSLCEQNKAKVESFIQRCAADVDNCNCAELGEQEMVTACNYQLVQLQSQVKQFAERCYKDMEACSCSEFKVPRQVEMCEAQKHQYLQKAQAIVLQCVDDPFKCDCSSLGNHAGECQRQVDIGKQVRELCHQDLEKCDCSPIENKAARESCTNAKAYGLEFKSKFEKQCTDNPVTCDCATIPSAAGRKECEEKKQIAIKQAEGEIAGYMDACFANMEKCNCNALPKPEYVPFCKEMLGYGLSCLNEGVMCEKLEDVDMAPPGIPEFLRPYFKQSFRAKLEAAKQDGARKAGEIAKTCVLDPEKCDCSAVPLYARDFCVEKKTLQLSCINDKDIAACNKLDASLEVVPPDVPSFIRGPLDALLRPLVLIQKDQIKGQYAQETKDLILQCIDDIEKCRCNDVPKMYRDFCNHKVSLVKQCYSKNYNACFTVLDEKNIPDDVPGFIRVFIEGDVDAKVRAKGEEMLKKLAPQECNNLTLQQCRQKLEK